MDGIVLALWSFTPYGRWTRNMTVVIVQRLVIEPRNEQGGRTELRRRLWPLYEAHRKCTGPSLAEGGCVLKVGWVGL